MEKHDRNLFKRIEELDLSVRTINSLRDGRITFIGDLVQKTDRELLDLGDFGARSLTQVKKALAKLSLHLGSHKISGWEEIRASIIAGIKLRYEDDKEEKSPNPLAKVANLLPQGYFTDDIQRLEHDVHVPAEDKMIAFLSETVSELRKLNYHLRFGR